MSIFNHPFPVSSEDIKKLEGKRQYFHDKYLKIIKIEDAIINDKNQYFDFEPRCIAPNKDLLELKTLLENVQPDQHYETLCLGSEFLNISKHIVPKYIFFSKSGGMTIEYTVPRNFFRIIEKKLKPEVIMDSYVDSPHFKFYSENIEKIEEAIGRKSLENLGALVQENRAPEVGQIFKLYGSNIDDYIHHLKIYLKDMKF